MYGVHFPSLVLIPMFPYQPEHKATVLHVHVLVMFATRLIHLASIFRLTYNYRFNFNNAIMR